MNFKRKIITLSIILFVLTAGYVLGVIFSPERVEKRRANVPLLTNIKKSDVWKVKIKTKDGGIILAKDSNGWTLSINNRSFPADSDKVARFIDELGKLKKSKIITNNPDNWKNFDVIKDKAKRFILYNKSGGEISDLYIGKNGLGGQGFYVRKSKSNEVVQTDSSSISYYLNSRDNFWSYLKIFPKDIKKTDVIKITLKKDAAFDKKDTIKKVSYELFKGDSKKEPFWKVKGKDSFKLDDEKVGRVVEDLITIEGNSFAANITDSDAGLSDAKTIAAFTLQNNDSYSLLVGKEKQGAEQFYVKRSGGKYIYAVSIWKLKRIFKSLDSLKKEEKKAESTKNKK